MLGIVASVSGRGAPVCSSYAAALGLDAPIEVSRHTVHMTVLTPSQVRGWG